MKHLLAAGAELRAAAMDEMSSIHFAAQQGHTNVCQFLINAGEAGTSQQGSHFSLKNAYTLIVQNHDICVLIWSTRFAGTKVNTKTRKGTNALHFAAKKGHLAVVELLIKRKALVTAKDRKGNTALDLATDPAVKEALQAAMKEAAQPKVILEVATP